MRRPPRALLLDLGKVLVEYDWPSTLQKIARLAELPDTVALEQRLLEPSGLCDSYCRGTIDDDEFLAALGRELGASPLIEAARLRDLWCDMFQEIPGALPLVDRLKGAAHLGLLSNTNALHFAWLDRMCALRRRFDSITVSHEVGALKPELAIYEHALAAAGCRADEAAFVDDLAANVSAARSLGMHGIVFVSVTQLQAELAGLGLPT